jgi:hypothetical protein
MTPTTTRTPSDLPCYDYAAHAVTLRTSDLDTGFFHTDMKVLADQLPRSAHCSLLRTHKPGSPLLLCPARTPVPLAQVLTHCSIAPLYETLARLFPQVYEPRP